MKRFATSSNSGFARYGLRGHHVRVGVNFRGGRRL